MEWSEKWAELKELFIGLGGAFVVLFIVAWVFDLSKTTKPGHSSPNRAGKPTDPPAPREREEGPAESTAATGAGTATRRPAVTKIFITQEAGMPMRRVAEAAVVASKGLEGDRYFEGRGHWSHTDECEVTIIAQEDIDQMADRSDVRIQDGEHRRNLVTRNVSLESLVGKRFRIGTAYFGYERPRPPCRYIELVSEPGMAKALGKRAGICVRCFRSGAIQENDEIVVLQTSPWQVLAQRLRVALNTSRKTGHG